MIIKNQESRFKIEKKNNYEIRKDEEKKYWYINHIMNHILIFTFHLPKKREVGFIRSWYAIHKEEKNEEQSKTVKYPSLFICSFVCLLFDKQYQIRLPSRYMYQLDPEIVHLHFFVFFWIYFLPQLFRI